MTYSIDPVHQIWWLQIVAAWFFAVALALAFLATDLFSDDSVWKKTNLARATSILCQVTAYVICLVLALALARWVVPSPPSANVPVKAILVSVSGTHLEYQVEGQEAATVRLKREDGVIYGKSVTLYGNKK